MTSVNVIAGIIVVSFLTLSCSNVKKNSETSRKVDESGYSQFEFNKMQLNEFEKLADSGSNLHLQKLVDHYLFSSDLSDKNNRSSLIKWLKIGVVRGVKGHVITFLYIVKDGEADCAFVNGAVSSLDDRQVIADILAENSFVRSCREAR